MTERITTPHEFSTSDGPQSQPAPAPAYMGDLGAESDGRRPEEPAAALFVVSDDVDQRVIDAQANALVTAHARIAALTADNSRLEALGRAVEAALKAERDAAKARIAELEADRAEAVTAYRQACKELNDTESEVAAAEARLAEATADVARMGRFWLLAEEDKNATEARLAEATALIRGCVGGRTTTAELEVFLANQSAAPGCAEPLPEDGPLPWDDEDQALAEYGMPRPIVARGRLGACQVVSHPAQLLAVEAFKREQDAAPAPLAEHSTMPEIPWLAEPAQGAWERSGLTFDAGAQAAFFCGFGMASARIAEAIDLCQRGALAGQILEALRGE